MPAQDPKTAPAEIGEARLILDEAEAAAAVDPVCTHVIRPRRGGCRLDVQPALAILAGAALDCADSLPIPGRRGYASCCPCRPEMARRGG